YGFNNMQRKFEKIRFLQRLPASLLKVLQRLAPLASSRYAAKLAELRMIPLPEWNLAHLNHMTWFCDEAEKSALWPNFAGVNSYRVLRDMYTTASSAKPLDQLLSVYQKS